MQFLERALNNVADAQVRYATSGKRNAATILFLHNEKQRLKQLAEVHGVTDIESLLHDRTMQKLIAIIS